MADLNKLCQVDCLSHTLNGLRHSADIAQC